MARLITVFILASCMTLSALAEQRNLVVGSQTAEATESRVALIIGNSAYRSSPLKNPVNDSHAMSAKLKTLGFDVIERDNLTQRQVGPVLREFRSKLTPGSVALFFYAGHGMQVRGINYLPTVDAEIAGEEDVPMQSMNLNQVLELMDDAKTRMNLVFLDACRNNPYASSFRSATNGLSKVSAPSGTLISFATRPGSIAADGIGKNGIYTEKLLANMDMPIPIEQILKNVVSSVRAATKGRQEPWMEGSIEGDFYFVTAAVMSPLDLEKERKAQEDAINQAIETLRKAAAKQEMQQQATQASSLNNELSYWDKAMKSADKNDYALYLKKFPNGYFAQLATLRIATLQRDEGVRKKKAQQLAASDMATNQFGFTVGDRYSMRHIDKNIRDNASTNEIVIGAILKDGSLVSADKTVTLRADGTLKRIVNSDGSIMEWSDSYVDRIAPEDLIVGYRKDVSWTYHYERAEGEGEETHNGTIEVVGMETVKVPAGQFKAYKIVRRTKFLGAKKWRAAGTYRGTIKVTSWYVPLIRAIVASEIEIEHQFGSVEGTSISLGSLPDRYRDELVSYQVANKQIAQKD